MISRRLVPYLALSLSLAAGCAPEPLAPDGGLIPPFDAGSRSDAAPGSDAGDADSGDSSLDGGVDAGDDPSLDAGSDASADGGADASAPDASPSTETACDDAMDDDFDGDIDCADADCAADLACVEALCSDGLDDDGDGDVDCDDSDCFGSSDCVEIDCANGIDDDRDGDGDCRDFDCDGTPGCIETNCTNGLDDDGDTYGDCFDFDCYFEPTCGEYTCDDAFDDDGDGAADCADSECTCAPTCWTAAPTCAASELGSMLGSPVLTGTLDPFACGTIVGSCGGDGAEVSFRWTAPSAGTFVFSTDSTTHLSGLYDTVLYVRDGTCVGTELGCNDDTRNFQSEVTLTLAAGQTVIVVIDTYGVGEGGTWVLNITGP